MKKRIISDDEQDLDPEEPVKDHDRSDDEEKEALEDGGPQMLDFDLMMQKKREENRKLHNKRRKTKDIDMINDNDDAIAKLMADMRMAAHEDREHNQKVIKIQDFLSENHGDIIPELGEIEKPELSNLFSELRIPLILEVLQLFQ